MANKDNAVGLIPVRGPMCTNEYIVTTGQTIYKGDLIKIVAAGTVEESDANDGVIVVGVAAHYVDDSASAGGKKVLVYDDPNTIFKVQCDTGTVPTAADIGATANHVAGAGDATSKLSGHELDASDIGTGGQLKIMRLFDRPDNSWLEHVDVEVVIAEHFNKAAVVGV